MSLKYDDYLEEHIDNVKKAFDWMVENLPHLFDKNFERECHELILNHDDSKYSREEYEPYDNYFYGNQSYEVVQNFNRAWLNHIHNNPHHWQHWVLINDNPEEGEILIDMPDCYIIEMICDWWSFSWKKGKLDEIFNWYNEHKDYMKLSDYTRRKVEEILNSIKYKLKEV